VSTSPIRSALPEIAPPPPRKRVEWRKARTALRNLITDPERTEQVFELIDALAGNSGEVAFQRFLAHPNAPALLNQKPSLLRTLADLETLETLPGGSFGREYATFMRVAGLRADGLVDAADEAETRRERVLDPDRQFFFDRLRDMHDLWHVLTGYGRDLAGEAANLAFTYAQTGNRGIGLIVLASAWRGPKTLDFHWQRYLWRAWRRGSGTEWLPAAGYEELLPLPLDEVRRRLRIPTPDEAHPGGILVLEDETFAAATH
jgi:ubiquinone biosynthesis protein COQ4